MMRMFQSCGQMAGGYNPISNEDPEETFNAKFDGALKSYSFSKPERCADELFSLLQRVSIAGLEGLKMAAHHKLASIALKHEWNELIWPLLNQILTMERKQDSHCRFWTDASEALRYGRIPKKDD